MAQQQQMTAAQLEEMLQKVQKSPQVAELMSRGLNWQTIVQMVLALLAALGIYPPAAQGEAHHEEPKAQKQK